jgi:signal transduction histidine kinase
MGEQRTVCLALIAIALAGPTAAGDADFGTPQEAKAMLARAITEVKTDKRAAIDKFNHNDPGFRDRDLFVFCLNAGDGRFTAHEGMVTHDARELRDPAGDPIGERILHSAREGEVAEIAYRSQMPGSTKRVERLAYVTRIADQVCGVSAYRDAAVSHDH